LYELPKNDKTLRINLDGNLAMAYYCCNEPIKGDSISLTYINRFLNNPISEILPSIVNTTSLMDYFIKNAILRHTNKNELKKLLKINYKILPFWNLFIHHENLNFHDIYNASPAKKIILIEGYLKTKDSKINQIIAAHTFEQFSYFSKTVKEQLTKLPYDEKKYRKLLAQIELQPNNRSISNELIRLANGNEYSLNIQKVQDK
jgi:hypothetical protein